MSTKSVLVVVALMAVAPVFGGYLAYFFAGEYRQQAGLSVESAGSFSVLINQERAKAHLRPLASSPKLNEAASQGAYALSHTSKENRDIVRALVESIGYRFSTANRNYSSVYAYVPPISNTQPATAEAVIYSWMLDGDSASVILDPGFANIGVGVVNHHIEVILAAPGE